MMERESRIKALDSLRGLAAATVVIAHACGILIKGHSFDEYTPLYLFRAAHESVIFFFLLSGFVLTYQIQVQKAFNYRDFIIQRIFRIYVPYLIVISFTFIIYAFFQQSDIEKHSWQKQVTFEEIVNHVILLGNFDTNAYNNVIWSLVHEIRVAAIFPVLLYFVSFEWRKVVFISFILSILVGLAVTFGFSKSEGYNNSYLYTVHYFSFFVLGALIVKHNEHLNKLYLELNNRKRLIILLCCLLVFSYSRMIFLIPHKFKFHEVSLFLEFIADWFSALAAVYFIIAASHIVNSRNLLLQKIPLFLGKVSYSLYLIHLPVIVILFNLFPDQNKLILMIASISVAVLLSFLSSTYIERTSARLGKRLVKKKRYSKNIMN